MSEIIAEKLIDIESVKFSFENHFTLTSGLKSPVYVDCRKIISFLDEREFIMNEALNYFEKNKIKFDLTSNNIADYKRNIEEVFFTIFNKKISLGL